MQTPHKRSFAAEELARQKKASKKYLPWFIVAGLVIIAAGYFFYSRFCIKESVGHINSIAVLPFVDMSPEKDQAHLGDGVADAIINAINHVEELRVIDRTSSFQFRDREDAIDEIGEKLNVDAVLEGSVYKSGNRLRIIAQLIRVSDHSHFFSKTYDIEFSDIFAIQDTLSLAVLRELKFTLMGNDQAAIVKRYTNDPDAYEMYLQGQNKDVSIEGIKYFEKAIEKDPQFAFAYTAIAEYNNLLGYGRDVPPDNAFPKAREAALQALHLDDSIAEAHTNLGWTSLYYDWDWATAKHEFERAIEINPGSALAYRWYKDYYMVMGDFEKVLELMKRYHELDPVGTLGYLGYTYVLAGHYDEAQKVLIDAKKSKPDDWWIPTAYSLMYERQGNYEKALEETVKIGELIDLDIFGKIYVAYIYARLGEREKAESLINETKQMSPLRAYYIARTYLALEDFDKTLEWLEKAYEVRDASLPYIYGWPEWEPIRNDPRYKALLKKMGLPEN